MPLHEVALELLKETGPLAVSSANSTGARPATTAGQAEAQLGDAVAVYLDGGPCPGEIPSTIIDLTGSMPKLLRAGVIPVERIREVITLIVTDDTAGNDTAGNDTATDETAGNDTGPDGTQQEDTGPGDTPRDSTGPGDTPRDGMGPVGAATD
jgi:hypothetical protein